MPTNRKRKARRVSYRGVSPRAASLYREAKNCSDQQRAYELGRELHGELWLLSWENSPLWPGQPFSLILPPVDFDHKRSEELAWKIRAELEQQSEKVGL